MPSASTHTFAPDDVPNLTIERCAVTFIKSPRRNLKDARTYQNFVRLEVRLVRAVIADLLFSLQQVGDLGVLRSIGVDPAMKGESHTFALPALRR